MFQSTHPRGVRPTPPARGRPRPCFNPRTHAGCDQRYAGARVFRGRFNPRTHAGCDVCRLRLPHLAIQFQSTHPRGVRQYRFENVTSTITVSIHAPTRGATSEQRNSQTWEWFQSTHPRGVRPDAAADKETSDKFQSTHPRGVRPLILFLYQIFLCFNPRTHAGCDTGAGQRPRQRRGFNPRTHAGCDKENRCRNKPHFCFNPRTHAGCDRPPPPGR